MRHISVSRLVFIAAMAACALVPTSAQVQTAAGGTTPNYVDNDEDPQPYYIDGVQYKPYVPEKKKTKPSVAPPAAAPISAPVAAIAPQANDASLPDQLHPYEPAASEDVTPDSKPTKTAVSSSSESADVYVPKKRARYAVAVIEALDKVTAESVRFEVPIGKPTRYKGLIYVVKACETTADDEMVNDVMAYMRVRTNPVSATATTSAIRSKEVFKGWTFASTPGLNPIQHPVYDAWVISCRQPLPGVAS